MAQYIEILPDGTRRVVTYNPSHDGPISERITLLKKIKWLDRYCKSHPGHYWKKDELSALQRKLHFLDQAITAAKRSSISARHPQSHNTPQATQSFPAWGRVQSESNPSGDQDTAESLPKAACTPDRPEDSQPLTITGATPKTASPASLKSSAQPVTGYPALTPESASVSTLASCV